MSAMKEAKALSVPSAQYNEEDLPSVQLEYGSVSDKEIMTSSVNGYATNNFYYLMFGKRRFWMNFLIVVLWRTPHSSP